MNSRGCICHIYFTTGMHLNVHWCTLKCIPRKWLHFKRPSHYYQSKDCLDVGHFILYRPRLNLIVRVSLMPNHDLWFANKKHS